MNAFYVICGLGVFSLLAEIINLKRWLIGIVTIGMAAVVVLAASGWNLSLSYYHDMVVFDNFAIAVTALIAVLGMIFLVVQYFEWAAKSFTLASTTYSSLYFVITGFHMAHVAVGVLILSCLALWIAMGRVRANRHAPLTIGGLYWHFVDAVWIVIFSVLYLGPHVHD